MSAEDLRSQMEARERAFQVERDQLQQALAQAQAQAMAQVPPAAGLMDQAQPGAAVKIGSLVIRLPNFWTLLPELWFAQAEASFETRNPKVTSDTSNITTSCKYFR